MKKLLSLPPNLVGCFHDITGLDSRNFFCTHDPIGHKLGSGGGTTWLLEQCFLNEDAGISRQNDAEDDWLNSMEDPDDKAFGQWLAREKRILLHAGGQSRRLPAYAPSGKILTPIPVFRWERGQQLSQTLLDLQLPLYEELMKATPDNIHTMVVSGDVFIRSNGQVPEIPDADVVCFGLWLNSSIAKNHGVFVSDRRTPNIMKRMLQKPSVKTLNELQQTDFYLTDIGVWMLSDRAVECLRKHSRKEGARVEYDLYGEFGCALGTDPLVVDEELKQLTVAVIPLPGGEFYHYGTSREMIASTLAVQNLVNDQREIMHHGRKPHPSIFVQNSHTDICFNESNTHVWIENSWIGEGWKLSDTHIITGVPKNNWNIELESGYCIDIVPIREDEYAVRQYHVDDRFAGTEQQEDLFPLVKGIDTIEAILNGAPADKYISAEEISNTANLRRLVAQRRQMRNENWRQLADNYRHSVFYQLDLEDAARAFRETGIDTPKPLPDTAPLMTRIHDAMFRASLNHDEQQANKAFSLLREGLTATVLSRRQHPVKSVYDDQIVWARSPVRIDIAGGWTDTPPFCLMEGGDVVNLAIELNGQPPLQTYIKPCKEPHIVCRSIDLGAVEHIETYEQLADFNHVGSPFSIPKAALALAGFLPDYCDEAFPTLKAQLEHFGCGIELTLLSAIPAGSGLGTSSILAATVLAAVSDFCSLAWDKSEIGKRTLVLEQLLTTGGGWQDQFGGIYGGVKLLQSQKGFEQTPLLRWLPDGIYTQPDYAQCHLLYYTGITRTAKTILAEIVRRMFLNQHDQLRLLRQMKNHTMDMYEAIQRQDFKLMGALVKKTWEQNQRLDSGTNPDAVKAITNQIDDLCLGYKLPGAGGGGYLYMVAKDPEAAARIRQILGPNPPYPNARFVDMRLSTHGLQVSRS